MLVKNIEYSPLGLIGKTPLIKLQKIVPDNGVEIWLKVETGNPTGSYKDRMALSVLINALETDQVKIGETVVEYTGGSTGSSLAFVSAALGLNFTAVFSDAFSLSKKQTMEAFGATVIVIESLGKGITPELIREMKLKAYQLTENSEVFYADQFGSEQVVKGYIPMGAEISEKLDTVDVFCAAVGTGGALMGTWEGINNKKSSLIAFEPKQSPFLTTGKGGAHRVEGIGVGFEPPFLDRSLLSEVLCIDENDAFDMCKQLASEEGIFCGSSTGMNVVGALKVAKSLRSGSRVVTLACDNGLKYVGSHVYNQ